MATILAEAIVSESVKLLLGKIVSREFVDFLQSNKLDYALLERLRSMLLSLQAVLNDAGQKQITNGAVKEWLDMLQDVVFEAEDLFDEINTEALRCKVKAEQKGKRAKVQKFLYSHFKSSYRTFNSEMQRLHIKLKDLVDQVHLLGLRQGISSIVWHGTPTSSVAVDESSIYGRDNDTKKLKNFLLSDDAREGGGKIGVISIVGMGGLGKTTLAKLLYNDPEVKQKFNLNAWAHISRDFDDVKVTKALLESVTKKSIGTNNLDTLQVQLQQSLSGKMFLLVLDDIWDVDYVVWDSLKNIFNVGDAGSRIIITTRNERDALTMKTFLPIHKLERLESEDCWSLLAKHAFGASNYQQCSNLEEIGREIAQKCDGLPLAAVALGGLLRTKLSPDRWNHVLKSNIWELENTKVQPALILSYHYLPGHLKRCFAYCAIFPKNYKLKKKTLVQLWIAEGLVLPPNTEKSWENVGEEYFDELVSRSLIHRRFVDKKEIFEMHDLMNDLATTVSSPYCIRLEEQKPQGSLERVRYLSYNRDDYHSYNKDEFDRLHGFKGLRTFLSLLPSARCIPEKSVHNLLTIMKHLHVLSLQGYSKITKLPNSIGDMIYLRHLNLSYTSIERLPSKTCNLYNLQTLSLSECIFLVELPKNMGKLVNLRNLDVSNSNLCEMPVQIAKLQNLQILSDFMVSEQREGLKVGDLGKLSHLCGKLSITGLQNVTDPSDAFQANLEMKKQIEELTLEWAYDPDSQIGSDVLEQLRPSTNLKSLTISYYGGTKFSNWLGDSLFSNMVYIKIYHCCHCSLLPPVGHLSNLKDLIICSMILVKTVGAEFYGSGTGASFQSFPSLETLSFYGMPEWEEWNLIGGTTTEFPVLRHLALHTCPKLKGNIPTNLPSLTDLELSECPLLVEPWSSEDNSNTTSSINDCDENMNFIAHESLHNYTSLEYLEIVKSCSSMTSLTLGSFPVLKALNIQGCEKLKSIIIIAEDAPHQQSLSFLTDITIEYCDELESFSSSGLGFGSSIPNLGYLGVSSCKKLRSLPEPMNTLVGLRDMEIYDLPNLQCIAKDGFPINLQRLEIGSIGGDLCNIIIVLERLTCLSELEIKSGDIVEALMTMEAPLLPTSLVTLNIYNLGDIECLDGKWLHHLTSLQNIFISEAPNLKSFPEEGFPSSLSRLSIYWCPLLEAILKGKQGKEWSKVAHIPTILINGKRIK